MKLNNGQSAVLDANWEASPLSQDAHLEIYRGWTDSRQDQTVEIDAQRVSLFTKVTFCGVEIAVEPMMCMNVHDKRFPGLVKRLAAFIKQLNLAGSLAINNPEARDLRTYVGKDDSYLFQVIVNDITTSYSTSWKVVFVEPTSGPKEGLDARVIVPQ